MRPFLTQFRRRWLLPILAVALVGTAAMIRFTGAAGRSDFSAVASRGDLSVALTETGTLRPVESITYRSPLVGREAEVIFIAPEGLHVQTGDLLVRLDTTELTRDLERSVAAVRQAEIDVTMATATRDDAAAELESVTEGERAIDIDEAKAKLQIAEKNLTRRQSEFAGLQPMLEKGFITKDELEKSALEIEQAQSEISVMRKRVALMSGDAHTREETKARLQVAQRDAQLADSQQHARDLAALVSSLRAAIDGASLYARGPGLVVHEELLGANPRRKVRVGDRVSSTQGLVTIPEVDRMLVDASVRESDLWRVRPGLGSDVTVDAFPAKHFVGRVRTVGTLGQGDLGSAYEEKRFEVTIALDSSDPDLRPAMTARARIVVAERRQVVMVPAGALTKRGAEWFLLVSGTSGLSERRVTVGETDGVNAEILDGLREGERVSLSQPNGSASGQR